MSNNSKISTIKAILKLKFQHKKKSNDYFIIKYNKNNHNSIKNVELLDQRRIVFVSLRGLYRTWKTVPSVHLMPAIIIVPLKRCWLYNPLKYTRDISIVMNIFEDMIKNKEFVELLKYKDHQGLVFWMFNEFNEPSKDYKHKTGGDRFTAPFWIHFSRTACNLYDPVTKSTYKPIQCSCDWWEQLNTQKLKFCDSIASVLQELLFLTMRYKQMQEIIYQANPISLNPIISYEDEINGHNAQNEKHVDEYDLYLKSDSNWHVLVHYDPYDLET